MDLTKSSSNVMKMFCGLDIHKRKKYYASFIYKRMGITMNYSYILLFTILLYNFCVGIWTKQLNKSDPIAFNKCNGF